MELKEYKKIVELTAIYPQKIEDFGKCYVLLGIMGESVEASRERRDRSLYIQEAYDVIWYLAAACKEFNLDFEKIYEKSCTKNTVFTNYNIFEAIKKYYRDGKPFDLEHVEKFLIEVTTGLISSLTPEERAFGLEYNYNKLIKRRETNTIHGDGSNREQEL